MEERKRGEKRVSSREKLKRKRKKKEKTPTLFFSLSLSFSFSYLARLQRLRDHAHHALASVAHGLGHGAHQADVAACWFCFGKVSEVEVENERRSRR